MIKKITNSFNGDNLKAKCARSSGILGLGTVADKGLAFASKMILVRLLLPEEIGLIVLVLSLTAMFEVFTEVGIKQSVIQHKNGSDPGYLNMAWWFQSVRASCLYAVAFLATPLVCKFYFAGKSEVLGAHSFQELNLLVRVAFLSILFNGFISPRAHVLEKEFKFFKSVLIIQGSAVIGTIITIALAYFYRNVWAMVIGFTCMAILRCVVSFFFCPFMPRFEFDNKSFAELLRFAKGMFGIPILTYFALNIDVLVAGKMVPANILGMYGMAIVLARIPRELFSRIVYPTLLPAFAEKQDNLMSLCDAVNKITNVTVLIIFPSVVVAALYGKVILSFVYRPEFSQVALPFAVLCLSILFRLESIILTSVLFAIGQPGKHRLFVGVRFLILAILIYPFIELADMSGAASAVLISNLIAFCLQVVILNRTIGLVVKNYFISYFPGIAVSVVVVLSEVIMSMFLPGRDLLHMISSVILMLVSIALFLYIKYRLRFDIKSTLRSETLAPDKNREVEGA